MRAQGTDVTGDASCAATPIAATQNAVEKTNRKRKRMANLLWNQIRDVLLGKWPPACAPVGFSILRKVSQRLLIRAIRVHDVDLDALKNSADHPDALEGDLGAIG